MTHTPDRYNYSSLDGMVKTPRGCWIAATDKNVRAIESHQAMADALLAAAATVWWAAENAAEQIDDEAQQVIAVQRRAVLAQIEAALSHKGE